MGFFFKLNELFAKFDPFKLLLDKVKYVLKNRILTSETGFSFGGVGGNRLFFSAYDLSSGYFAYY